MKSAKAWIQIAVLWGMVLGLLSCAAAPALVSQADWADGVLEETGIARVATASEIASPAERLRAIRDAKANAYARLTYQLMQRKMPSGETVFEWVDRHPSLHAKVAAFVRSAKIVQMGYQRQHIEMKVRLYVGDGLKSVLGLLPRRPLAPPPSH